MKKKTSLLIVAVLVGIIATTTLLVRSKPKYLGKSAEEWLFLYSRGYLRAGEGSNAFFHLGSRGTLFLSDIAFSSRQDPLIKAMWVNVRPMLPDLLQGEAVFGAGEKADAADSLLLELKPNAAVILPQIQEAMRSPDKMVRRQSYYLMGCIGPGANRVVPLLIRGLNDPDIIAQRIAIQSLKFLGTNSSAAVPQLTGMLINAQEGSWNAVDALGGIGTAASNALPKLRQMFEQETEPRKRMLAASVLCKIDEKETTALSYLEKSAQGDADPTVPPSAIYQLGQLEQRAKSSIPILVRIAQTETNDLWQVAFSALRRIETNRTQLLQILREKMVKLESTDRAGYLNVSLAWLQMQPNHQKTIEALIQIAGNPQEQLVNRVYALNLLEDFAILQPRELKQLQQLAHREPNGVFRSAARLSLKKIRTKVKINESLQKVQPAEKRK